MMNELSERKIDKRQFKTLLAVALKTDLRGFVNPMKPSGEKRRKLTPFLFFLLGGCIFGLCFMYISSDLKNPFTYAFYVFTNVALLLASLMIQFSNLILSPDEYQIVAPRPIGSKTFFAVKLAHLLVYVNTLGLLLYLPSAVSVSVVNRNFWLLLSFAMAGLILTTTVGTALAVFCALVLKLINRKSMQRVIGYTELILISLFYFGYFAVGRLISMEAFAQVGNGSYPWIYLTPPAWFAALVKFPAGGLTFLDVGTGVLAVILFCLVFQTGISRFSTGYAQALSNIAVEQQQIVSARKKGVFAKFVRIFSTSEDRAVWRLIYKQFKYDGLLGASIIFVVSLTAIYVTMGICFGGAIVDPFTVSPATGPVKLNYLLYLSPVLFSLIVAMETNQSESYRSAWIFFASPADHTRIVISSARFSLIFFCLPYSLLLLGIFIWFFGNFVHALLHCLIIYVMLMILSKLVVLFHPQIPFSRPVKTWQRSVTLLVMLFFPIPLILVPRIVISEVGYGGYIVFLFSALVIYLALYGLIRKTIPRRVNKNVWQITT